MLNIMDLASRYLPDLEKLAAGISSQYANASSNSSFSENFHRYKKRRPIKGGSNLRKRRKKVIMLKKKIEHPERGYGGWGTVGKRPNTMRTEYRPGMGKVNQVNVKTVPKLASQTRAGKPQKKGEKKSPEKVLRVTNLGSRKAGVKDDKGQQKKKTKINTNKVAQALTDFKRKKTQFMISLKTLQKELSNMKVPVKEKTSATKPKTCIKKKKTERIRKSKKETKKTKQKKSKKGKVSTESESNSSSSSTGSGTTSSPTETTSQTASTSEKRSSKKKFKTQAASRRAPETIRLTKHGQNEGVYQMDSCPGVNSGTNSKSKNNTHKSKNSLTIKEPNWVLEPKTNGSHYKPAIHKKLDPKLLEEYLHMRSYATTQPLFRAIKKPKVKQKPSPKRGDTSNYNNIKFSRKIRLERRGVRTMRETLPKCTVFRGKQ